MNTIGNSMIIVVYLFYMCGGRTHKLYYIGLIFFYSHVKLYDLRLVIYTTL